MNYAGTINSFIVEGNNIDKFKKVISANKNIDLILMRVTDIYDNKYYGKYYCCNSYNLSLIIMEKDNKMSRHFQELHISVENIKLIEMVIFD